MSSNSLLGSSNRTFLIEDSESFDIALPSPERILKFRELVPDEPDIGSEGKPYAWQYIAQALLPDNAENTSVSKQEQFSLINNIGDSEMNYEFIRKDLEQAENLMLQSISSSE